LLLLSKYYCAGMDGRMDEASSQCHREG